MPPRYICTIKHDSRGKNELKNGGKSEKVCKYFKLDYVAMELADKVINVKVGFKR